MNNSTVARCLRSLGLCLVLLLGGCGDPEPTPAPVPTATPAPATPAPATPVQAAAATWTPAGAATPPTPVLSATPLVTATGCAVPAGWVRYTVGEGDTLSRLEVASGASVSALMQANCLADSTIYLGQTLWLPVAPPPTATQSPEPTRCAAPAGWVVWVVQPGDTLSTLAAGVGASVESIRQANCLPDDTIYAGRGLWLPRQPAADEEGTACAPFACSPVRPIGAFGEEVDFGSGFPGGQLLCADGAEISVGEKAPNGTIWAMDGIFAGGERILGACGATEDVTFTLTRSGSVALLLPTTTITVDEEAVQAAVWEATCAAADSEYTIAYVTASSPAPVTRTFRTEPFARETGYVSTRGGGVYRVHLCGGSPPVGANSLILFQGRVEGNKKCAPETFRSWPPGAAVRGEPGGWFLDLTLPLPGDRGDCYVLQHRDGSSNPPFVQISVLAGD